MTGLETRMLTSKVVTHDEPDEVSEEDYKEEYLEKMLIYFSNFFEKDSSDQSELEFNPQINFYSPENSKAKTDDDDNIDSMNANEMN